MTAPPGFACTECLDTGTIDRDGAEIRCPYCEPLVKLTGLSRGLGCDGALFFTARHYSRSTIEFYGRPADVLADVRRVRAAAEARARAAGYRGRNWMSSGPVAIERRVSKALARDL
jgi:hypothetical protein